jgi:hypothetical protein
MDNWNDDHFFTKGQKIYFLICGILVVLSFVWVNYIFWEYRNINQEWNNTFVSPKEFWDINRTR